MLEQKVAVVTGASRGIGRAIAEKLAEEGVFVVINYRGNEEQAKQVQQTIKEQVRSQGGSSIFLRYPVFWEMQGRQTTVRPKQV